MKSACHTHRIRLADVAEGLQRFPTGGSVGSAVAITAGFAASLFTSAYLQHSNIAIRLAWRAQQPGRVRIGSLD